jgi:hypothetical protein
MRQSSRIKTIERKDPLEKYMDNPQLITHFVNKLIHNGVYRHDLIILAKQFNNNRIEMINPATGKPFKVFERTSDITEHLRRMRKKGFRFVENEHGYITYLGYTQ